MFLMVIGGEKVLFKKRCDFICVISFEFYVIYGDEVIFIIVMVVYKDRLVVVYFFLVIGFLKNELVIDWLR